MTPTGVEHSTRREGAAYSIRVNRSMTPTGVEHTAAGRRCLQRRRGVNRSMTPTGVEHQVGCGGVVTSELREPIYDADRR